MVHAFNSLLLQPMRQLVSHLKPRYLKRSGKSIKNVSAHKQDYMNKQVSFEVVIDSTCQHQIKSHHRP